MEVKLREMSKTEEYYRRLKGKKIKIGNPTQREADAGVRRKS